MIVKQDQDSIFITADTLFSARLSDLYKAGDSVKTLSASDSIQIDTIKTVKEVNTKEKDSTDRYFQAFYHVRIFSDSVQAGLRQHVLFL